MLSGVREGAVIKRLPVRKILPSTFQPAAGGATMVVLNGEPLDGHQKNYSLQLYLPVNIN